MKLFKSTFALLITISLALLMPAAKTSAQQAGDFVRPSSQYYAVFLDDAKLGYAHERVQTSGQVITTINDMKISMDRFGTQITIDIKTVSRESRDLKPISLSTVASMGPMTIMDNKITFEANRATVTANKGGRTSTKTLTIRDGNFITTPQATIAYVKKLNESKTTDGSYTMVDSERGRLTTATIKIIGYENIQTLGGTKKLLHYQQEIDSGPMKVVTDNWVDENYQTVRSKSSMMSMNLDVVAADKKYATAPGKSYKVGEMSLTSPVNLAEKAARFANPYELKYTFRMRLPRDTELNLPQSDLQKVRQLNASTLEIVTFFEPPQQKVPLKYTGADREITEFLKSTSYVQCDSAAIVAKASEITAGLDDRYTAAMAIQKWVHDNVKDVLDVPYNSAEQTLESLRGDCSEHAALSAALCRAVGIPAKIVNGFVYAEQYQDMKNTFIGHAWCQVYIDGKWRRLDAAYDQPSPRIACAMGHGDPIEMATIAQIIGSEIVSAKVEPK